VLVVAFGATVPRSLAALLGGLGGPATPPITDATLLRSVLFEIAILALLALFLRLRGWSVQRIGLAPGWVDTGVGVLLAIACYVLYALLWIVVVSVVPRIASAAPHLIGGPLSWPAMLLVSVVNPVFEELLLCGYLITALRERAGVVAAVNASAGLRVFCHFYQGAVGLLGIVPLALLFAWWYARTGRLWPLIVAHAVLDIAGLALGR
jgi:uncharacterized protein